MPCINCRAIFRESLFSLSSSSILHALISSRTLNSTPRPSAKATTRSRPTIVNASNHATNRLATRTSGIGYRRGNNHLPRHVVGTGDTAGTVARCRWEAQRISVEGNTDSQDSISLPAKRRSARLRFSTICLEPIYRVTRPHLHLYSRSLRPTKHATIQQHQPGTRLQRDRYIHTKNSESPPVYYQLANFYNSNSWD